ncbi:hypothetical protein PSECIP111951_01275 [Pseudoalteromonas holothuriae]|uniref:Uncharacterized protein n=1 Tax=Pseudoalteromonas holothuriae TaxID=2963714 RepID=A0A9W4VLD4_9GAMM|nr:MULTISPECIES: hypothetical protein [unclassified Pseudoalteromonas]CAH9049511.1 hypothetical protein PSECIP111854_00145 [Pseudoalteromonas sp. CIP111854]CAH9055592.1 hypothetical protein PSECIP111951_01275 [Pseudoalteromonas sp. CIP111951]
MSAQDQTTTLKPAVNNPNNIEAKKYYVFNETGNIMMSSTVDANNELSDSVQKVFSEVSVFFAGMSRAISTTINPATKKPYSLYNYEALQNVISGSGLFVHVTEEDVNYETSSFGADFSKELIESLLGLATGAGEMSFASAMVSSIGKEGLKLSGSSKTSSSKVGNIVFVCEYLFGMPSISAIVVYAECDQHAQQLKLGPCFSESSISSKWKLHKDTYMFVTPTFIKNYAGDLSSINSDPEYLELVNWLSGLLTQTPLIVDVINTTDNSVVDSKSALAKDVTYKLQGQFLQTDGGSLGFTGSNSKAIITATSDWTADAIEFTVSGTLTQPASIQVLDKSGHVITQTAQTFTIAS